MPETGRPTVILADDHDLILDALRGLLCKEYRILQEVRDGLSLVESALKLMPNFVVLDVSMPHLSGIEAARQIRRHTSKVLLIFVTMQTRREYISECFRAGASGYVLKTAATKELPEAVRTVLRGGKFVSAGLHWDSALRFPAHAPSGALTSRQLEVLQLVAEGNSAKEIGDKLCISSKTVEFHKSRIQSLLGLRSTADMIRYALLQR